MTGAGNAVGDGLNTCMRGLPASQNYGPGSEAYNRNLVFPPKSNNITPFQSPIKR